MKAFFFFPLLLLGLTSCQENQSTSNYTTTSEVVTISGDLTGFENTKELSFYIDKGDTSIQVSANEAFTIQLPIQQQSYFYFQLGKEYGTIYAGPGDSIQLQLNYSNFDETLSFSGTHKNENNYLIENYLFRERELSQSKQQYENGFVAFRDWMNTMRNQLNNKLNKYPKSEIDSAFVAKEINRNNLYYFKKIVFFPSEYRHFTNKQADLPQEFFKELSAFDDANAELLQFDSFEEVLKEKLSLQQPILDKDNSQYPLQLYERATQLSNEQIRDRVLYNIVNNEYKFGSQEVMIQLLNDNFKEDVTNDSLLIELSKIEEKRQELRAGKQAPALEFINNSKTRKSLEDFKGKLVYIDFWATWCKPCREEIPFFNQLINEYADDEIVFIGISLDRDENAYENWTLFTQQKKLQGEQFIALDHQKETVEKYHIYGIPRYVLLDRDGKIISAFAPKPSDQDLVKSIINEHL